MNDKLNKLFEENIRNQIQERNYTECTNLLKQKINELFTYKISKKVLGFKYTSLEDLIDIGAPVLKIEDAIALNEYYLSVRKDSGSEFQVYKLLEIYKKIK